MDYSPPQALYKDIVNPPTLSIHADLNEVAFAQTLNQPQQDQQAKAQRLTTPVF